MCILKIKRTVFFLKSIFFGVTLRELKPERFNGDGGFSQSRPCLQLQFSTNQKKMSSSS